MERINSSSLNYHLRRFFLGRKNYKLAAVSSNVIYPNSSAIIRPAIFKKTDLSKIQGVQKETSFDHEYLRINGGEISLAPTTSYVLENVIASDGNIYKSNMKYVLRNYSDKIFIDNTYKDFSSVCLMSSYMGCKYFGHWMRDDLSKYLAAVDIDTPISCLNNQTIHQTSYQKIFGIQPELYSSGTIKKLTILEDYSQNEYKRQRYQFLRDVVGLNYKKSDKKGVMILRGASGTDRDLLNEQQVAEYLSGNGFEIVDISCSSVDEIIEKCRVDIVVSVEGSHLGNCIYPINDGGCIVTIQPPNRFNNVYKDYTDCMGMNYGFIVGDNKAGEPGFTVKLRDIADILDRVEGTIYRRHV